MAPAGKFTSTREKRLWTASAIVILTIWSTASIAVPVAEYLRDAGLLGILFAVGFLLVVITIFWMGFASSRRAIEVGLLLGILAVYVLVLVRISLPEERTHLVEYSIVALLILEGLLERRANGSRVPYPFVLAFAVTAIIGLIDETIQLFLPDRVFDLRDVLFNTLAAFMAVGGRKVFGYFRRPDKME